MLVHCITVIHAASYQVRTVNLEHADQLKKQSQAQMCSQPVHKKAAPRIPCGHNLPTRDPSLADDATVDVSTMSRREQTPARRVDIALLCWTCRGSQILRHKLLFKAGVLER
jgi:hypothetical protein